MLVLASITDPLVEFAVNVIDAMGLAGIFVLMVAESACIPIPSEATMLFAGFDVARGDFSLFAVVAVGTAANVVGSWIAYAIGYYGRVDILEKHGRKLHIKPSHLRWADDWFARYGSATVFFSRMLPIVRTFISLPAGVARMPFWRFTILTALGCIPWILMLTLIGHAVGDNWEQWKDKLHYVDYAVAALIVLGLIWLVVRRRRGRRDAEAATAGRRCAALSARRSRSGCCTGRPSCCRSPRRATRPRSRGCWAGRSRAGTGRGARSSRSPCTPAPRPRC